jgi:hypothetical protein
VLIPSVGSQGGGVGALWASSQRALLNRVSSVAGQQGSSLQNDSGLLPLLPRSLSGALRHPRERHSLWEVSQYSYGPDCPTLQSDWEGLISSDGARLRQLR